MNIAVQYADLHMLRSGCGWPEGLPICQPGSADTCGHAPITAPTQRSDVLAQLGVRRLSLLIAGRRARDLRRSKQASLIEAQLQAVTAEILALK